MSCSHQVDGLVCLQDVREWCIDEVLIPPRFCNIPIPHSLVNLCVSQVWVTELIEFWGSYTWRISTLTSEEDVWRVFYSIIYSISRNIRWESHGEDLSCAEWEVKLYLWSGGLSSGPRFSTEI